MPDHSFLFSPFILIGKEEKSESSLHGIFFPDRREERTWKQAPQPPKQKKQRVVDTHALVNQCKAFFCTDPYCKREKKEKEHIDCTASSFSSIILAVFVSYSSQRTSERDEKSLVKP
jgi:hypothetical protein